jgi:YbbR domain-containing protein
MKVVEAVRRLRPQENLILKIGSLLAALLVWLTVASQEPVPFDLTVPLEIRNLPSTIAMPTDVPAEVRVKLRGRPSVVDQVALHEVGPVPLDLSRARPGPQILSLDTQSVRAPFGIEVVSLEPTVVELTLENLLRIQVPIEPTLTGEPAPDYEVTETEVAPPVARVSGAESALAGLERIATAPISVEGKRAPFEVEVPLFAGEAAVRIEQPETASVRFEIGEKQETRTLQVPVETVGWVPGRVTWEPRVLPLTVKGPIGQMRNLTEKDYTVTVRVDGLTPHRKSYQVEPAVGLRDPDGFPSVEILELGRPTIDVHVYPGEGS